ncbi:MAG: hypothetical protein MJ153_02740 [Clostridia bacterium]|nr:hypothetical protein [Clostridia bacterium]
MANSNIDMDKLMSEIRAEIEEKQLTNDIVSFDTIEIENSEIQPELVYSEQSLKDSLGFMITHRRVTHVFGIPGNIVVRTWRKIVRRLTAFNIAHLFAQQNDINFHLSNVIFQLNNYNQELSEKMPLGDRIDALERENKVLKTRLAELERKAEKM